MKNRLLAFVLMLLALPGLLRAANTRPKAETLPPLVDGRAPRNFDEIWAGFDPRAEPLEIETLKEWEEEDVVLRIVRFRIGVFKSQKATLAAVYGFPKDATQSVTKLPGLVQIHGGGQYADYKACLLNAKRGYATVSIAWAGRISAPDYRVTPAEVKLFWDGKTDDPKYKLTTDWGAVDGYHAPGRNPGNVFPSASPAAWTLDEVESPRNSGWFLCALAARRTLTFLEQQPEVDADKLGVYGHSMGGKITVLTAAADARVKASAPSCGGISDRDNDSPLYRATIGDDANLKHINCPVIFLSPSNDFHGRIDDLQKAVKEISAKDWRVTCSAHHNHQDTAEYQVAGPLWFDQYLKETFRFPKTPETSLELKTKDGVSVFSVLPDSSKPILAVDIYYTQQGQPEGEKNDMDNTKSRFWHHTVAKRTGNSWAAKLPLLSTDKPLWVYANVVYRLDTPVTGAGYYYGPYTATTFNLSSTMHVATPGQLEKEGVQATAKPSLVIETFERDWEKEWFAYKLDDWARKTHKVYDERWKAPAHAKLALEVRSAQPNKLVVGIDQYATEIQLSGGSTWQQIVLSSQDFRNITGDKLPDWKGIKELRLGSQETLRPKRGDTSKPLSLGAAWQGSKPEFRSLRWITEKAKYYPAFSWETVPVGFHFGKTASLMTDEEAQFVASHASFVCLEKGHASRQFKYTEEGIEREAQQLKKYNPNLKVIFYWNTFLDYPMFQAHEVYQKRPEWWLKTQDGTPDKKNGRIKRYDLSNPEVREWWTDVAQKAVIEGSCDGVFMDAFPQISASGNKVLWGIEKYDAIQKGLLDIIKETRLKIGDDKLIFYNGIRSRPSRKIGNDYAEFTDAVMIEHFGHFQSVSKECMLADIRAMTEAGKNGEIVVFKAWPGFAWIDQESMQLSLEKKREIAAKNITFPLAAFLVGAQENAYFIYNWGYRMKDGCLEWYPELDKKLGTPLAQAEQTGWMLKRDFEHASVWVNLEAKEANINWHD
ncbi:MAG: dienelactone hydrolase family protein [Phycisphaerae bacterium]|nr:dienelactone hydrolase family protein [Phycisphaerae bacterium]